MSDDESETVTVEIEIEQEMLEAMQRVRKKQRKGRGQRTAELSNESPARMVSNLLTRAYQSDLRRARNRGPSGGPVGADRRYNSDE